MDATSQLELTSRVTRFESHNRRLRQLAVAGAIGLAAAMLNAFDHNRGPEGSRWIAAGPNEQTVILLFDTPQTIRKIGVEVEELR
jgi:hypothetical protein